MAVTTAANETSEAGIRAVLVANGVLSRNAVRFLQAAVADAEVVIGVDGGTRHLLALDLLPHVVTGDFDSLTATERRSLEEQGVRLMPTPDQEYTDLDKAISIAVHVFRAETIAIFAATAGRLDHIYSNLSAILKHAHIAEISLVDEIAETRPIIRPVTLHGADLPGRTLSLMAFGPVRGVTTTGVRWSLTDETLAPGLRDGTLNEITEETVTIRHTSGHLLLMLHHA
jgi:thiamine pyrophosphokinase